ncbi:efflux RND transporter periplasmic adaptor subunit [Novosphingobium sediminicola]|uniref:RND family efflux transporter MFP subunit n=1 Tax=Novosphingobium sediminicola TaxID=563162 RepID=A0A7W6G4X7_9SPHN|nr:efflux RND transporter periplasmic adaptor subunit [Novosphingobium sediminicola]MBB3953726.1 RND family efflux transporter MFP subunit [Novosphingobium sediminicola]
MSDFASSSPSFRKPLLAGAAAFALILVAGTAYRLQQRSGLHEQSEAAAVPSVDVIHPGGEASNTLVLPGRLQAWFQAPVYARTNGYLRRWYVDIGQPVQAGQVLAEIDTPDVDQQLSAARAALATANAQRSLAQTTSNRWDRLVAQNAVSQQDADERRGNFAAREAMRNEASANVQRLQTVSGFKRIVAPFDGIVTSRSTDIGALIVAGTSTTQPLFTVSDVTRLRIYVSLPQAYVARLRENTTAEFTVPDQPGKTFRAQLARSSGSVDPESGAMLVQLVYDNHAGLLKPGAYAQVTFDFGKGQPSAAGAVRIPVSSLLFRREGSAVALADAQGRVSIKPVTITTDFGNELEVIGLQPTDQVIDNPADDIRTGDKVKATLQRNNAHA